MSATEVSVVPVSQSSSISALRRPLIGGPCAHLVNWNGIELACRRLIPTSADIANPEFRCYTVWHIPSWGERFVGIHWAIGSTAYNGIRELNDGAFAGIRWCRADSLEDAGIRFVGEAGRFGLNPEDLTVYVWSTLRDIP